MTNNLEQQQLTAFKSNIFKEAKTSPGKAFFQVEDDPVPEGLTLEMVNLPTPLATYPVHGPFEEELVIGMEKSLRVNRVKENFGMEIVRGMLYLIIFPLFWGRRHYITLWLPISCTFTAITRFSIGRRRGSICF